jgi:hypothetical protein
MRFIVRAQSGFACACALAIVLAISSTASNGALAADNRELTVIGESGDRHVFGAKELDQLPKQKVKAKVHDVDAEFEGPLLVDLLKAADVKFGDALKGPKAGTIAVFEAADGYKIALTLLDFDPATTDSVVLVATARDGKPLDEKEGPYRLVIPSDKRPIRWIRMLRTIRVANVKDLPAVEAIKAPETPTK